MGDNRFYIVCTMVSPESNYTSMKFSFTKYSNMHQFHHICASYANTKKIHKMFLYIDDLFFQDNVKKEKKIEYFCQTDTIHLIKL